MEKYQKVSPRVARKARNKVLIYVVRSSERWIIHNHKTRVCDQNSYTHVVLPLYTYPTTKSRIKIVDLSNLFIDIMYHYKTSKFGPTMAEMSKSFSS
jgi:hypothetical protein